LERFRFILASIWAALLHKTRFCVALYHQNNEKERLRMESIGLFILLGILLAFLAFSLLVRWTIGQ
jgi:multisubunit Na+/H+ antiporter MnhB subunit